MTIHEDGGTVRRLEVYEDNAKIEAAASDQTPRRTLNRLSRDSNPDVRIEVARNPNTPKKVLRRLAEDPSLSVLNALVMENPDTPLSALRKISEDYFGELWVASSPHTPAKLLKRLSRSSRSGVRRRVAENPMTPKKVLEPISHDSTLRRQIMENSNTDETTVIRLTLEMSEENRKIRKSLSALHTPTHSLRGLFEFILKIDDSEKGDLLAMLAEHPNSDTIILSKVSEEENTMRGGFVETVDIRESLAENPNSPEELLRELSLDQDEHVRERVAENLSTPIRTLFELADKGGFVGKAAMKNPNYNFDQYLNDFIEE